MGAEKESRKIQDVINKANIVWNRAHKEGQKNIFMDNIIKYPFNYFFLTSIFYLCPIFLYVFLQWMISVNGGDLSGIYWINRVTEILFNIPYYLFDIRLGVITSIASLLLSLYVSVGKYADGLGGVTNDARRVVYRRFARWVGRIIFFVYVVNFWHGLLAGYFQGGLSISYPFKYLAEAPGWGRDIVPGDVNLSRYGEMPLWVLLFFAWFTLASSFMLTYSEKDALIRNLFVLDGINRLMGREGNGPSGEYVLAQAAYNLDKDSDVAAVEKYGHRLLPVYDYIGFKFDTSTDGVSTDDSPKNKLINWMENKLTGRMENKLMSRIKNKLMNWIKNKLMSRIEFFVDCLVYNAGPVKRWHILIFATYLSLVFLPIIWAYGVLFWGGNLTIYNTLSIGIFGCIVIYAVRLTKRSRFIPYISALLYAFRNLRGRDWVAEFGNYLKLCSWNWAYVFIYAFAPTAFAYLSINLACEKEKCGIQVSSDNGLLFWLYVIFVYGLPPAYMFLIQKPIIEDAIVKYSQDSLGYLLERMRGKSPEWVAGLNYVAVAYVYCLMRDVDELYSEYEIEAGLSKRNQIEDKGGKSYYPMYPLNIKYKDSK